jgi:hypothetical protein
LTEDRKDLGDHPLSEHLSGESLLSVEKIAKAVGRKFSANSDISRFSITVENLSEGYKTFAILDGPQEQTANS